MTKHITTGVGERYCPRCNTPAETREHKSITAKHLNQPFYYSKWFNCPNKLCRTSIFMDDEFKVWNKNNAAKSFKTTRETLDQFSQFKEELDAKLKGLFE